MKERWNEKNKKKNVLLVSITLQPDMYYLIIAPPFQIIIIMLSFDLNVCLFG